MKTSVEAVQQNQVTDMIIQFVRESELVLESDGTPVVTDKGERFVQDLRESVERPNSGGSSGS
jgi:16S rRNA C1402 (ribose-2'-O) methylase RsmI